MQIASFPGDLSDITSDNLIHNRLNLRYTSGAGFTGALELRNRIFWGESIESPFFNSDIYDFDPGVVDLNWILFEQKSVVGLMQVDRAWLEWSSERWEFRFGRQRINWGINLLWNNNDLFNIYSLLDFDYEERPGTDAVRIQHHFKNYSSLEIAVSPRRNNKEDVIAARYRFNKLGYDFQVLGGLWQRDVAAGLGWAGNIRNAGFKGEATYFFPADSVSKDALSASASLDYVFDSGVFATIAYLYNSNGAKDELNFLDIGLTQTSPKNLMPAESSAAISLSHAFSPIVNINATVLWSPASDMTILIPSMSVSISNDWELSLFAQSFWLDQSGYRNVNNGVFIRLRWSFFEEVVPGANQDTSP